MTEWIDISDAEAWEKRPNKIELLSVDGKIAEFSVYTRAPGVVGIIMDGIGLFSENITHWRPK